MNIFWLDEDLERCASDHCNKHVVKMITEYAQLLSTALRMSIGDSAGLLPGEVMNPETGRPSRVEGAPFLMTHRNHPCAVWVRQSQDNYELLRDLGTELGKVYTRRYGKLHKSSVVIQNLPARLASLPAVGRTSRPLAMPDECKVESVVQSYRNYYKLHKRDIAQWPETEIPTWFYEVANG